MSSLIVSCYANRNFWDTYTILKGNVVAVDLRERRYGGSGSREGLGTVVVLGQKYVLYKRINKNILDGKMVEFLI